MQIAISQIRRDSKLQPRATQDSKTTDKYTEDIRNGIDFDPISLVFDGTNYWLWDGYHRVVAYESAGATHIEANVTKGTSRDAFRLSLGANAKHGLQRSNDDKRRAVTLAIEDEEFSKLSDRAIAEICTVSHNFVNTVRTQLSSDDSSNREKPKLVGKDGKLRPAKKPPKPVVESESQDESAGHEVTVSTRDGMGVAAPGEQEANPVRHDLAGNILPGALFVTFDAMSTYKEIDSHLDEAIRLINRLSSSVGGEWFSAPKSTLQRIREARQDTKMARPYGICVRCKGVGCKQCNDRGYLPQEVYERMEKVRCG